MMAGQDRPVDLVTQSVLLGQAITFEMR